MPKLTQRQLTLGTDRLRKLIAEVESFDPSKLEKYSPKVDALQAEIDECLSRLFGPKTDRYERYRKTLNWAAEIPSFGAETSLQQYRDDVVKGKGEVITMLAAAMRLLEEELLEYTDIGSPSTGPASKTQLGNNVFIGHGASSLWRELKDFLRDRLLLTVDEFTNVPIAGIATHDRLTELLDSAAFAFLVMTAEDDQPDGKKRARENVVHEAGLFQGRLGFKRAIVLLEEGCEEFSNIHGLGQIRFPKHGCAVLMFPPCAAAAARPELDNAQPSVAPKVDLSVTKHGVRVPR
jgi:hypothetical protein